MIETRNPSRRRFLRVTGMGLALLSPLRSIAKTTESTEKKAFRMPRLRLGLQSYTLRKFNFDEVLRKAGELEIRYLEFFPGHLPMDLSPEKESEAKSKLSAARIDLPTYGVVGFGSDEPKNRAAFEFARRFGIKTLTADPAPDSFADLAALVDEFGIRVAIHNHGPGSRYSTVDDVLAAVADHDRRIGACVDTGHFLRSREDPAEAIRRLGDRVHAVHLKDIRSYEDHANVVNGRGVLDLEATLRALSEIGFKGHMAIEYEADPDDPMAAVADCVAEVQNLTGDRRGSAGK